MPTGFASLNPCDVDPRRWTRCLASARAVMLAQGWIERSRKFDEVCRRRARQLWAKS